MVWRFFRFCLFLLVGGAAGFLTASLLEPLPNTVLGMVLASVLWFSLDLRRARSVLSWLRSGDVSLAPHVPGLWGEAADRTRRLLRIREKALQDSESRLQDFLAAIQASPNGIVLLDENSQIEWCNQTAALQWGLDPQRDLAQHVANLVRDPVFVSYIAGGDFSHDVVVPSPTSNSSRPLRLSVQLHRYSGNRKLMMSRDVTALEQADAMRRDFVANVSHEIRTPLTVLSGFVETLQTLPLSDAERTQYLALMARQAQRMQTLVDDLLVLSRLEGSPLPGLDIWVPVDALVMQCKQDAHQLSELMPGTTHRLSAVIEARSQLAATRGEVLSAMLNLVNNAVRYTPAGGEVSLRWHVLEDGRGEFSVADTGPGIPAEHIPRLTERFYRVDGSRSRETGGTGLGLAIVKHVVQRHGAQLRIESTMGKGSTFTITFPANRVRPQAALE